MPVGKNDFLTTMGTRIAQRRKELSLTQEQLAEKMGVSLQTISCIELGKKAIRPDNLANLCNVLDVSADYILFGKRDQQQINTTISKMAALDPEAYAAVQSMVDLLFDK